MVKREKEQLIVKPPTERLADTAREAARRGPPPVHLWNPPLTGDLDMEIRRDGSWHYLGSPIRRPALVRLFASILRREGAEHFLVTPVEKFRIRVADAPFVAVDAEAAGEGRDQVLTFTTNVGDAVTADPDHPIRVAHDPRTGAPAPYLHVRDGLEALIDRKTFYRLVDLATVERHDGADWLGLWSGGRFFPLAPAAELP